VDRSAAIAVTNDPGGTVLARAVIDELRVQTIVEPRMSMIEQITSGLMVGLNAAVHA
jgi:hypothetical protein